jgi:hypothetical protein
VKMNFSNSLSFFKNRLPTFLKLHDACRVDVARKFRKRKAFYRFVLQTFGTCLPAHINFPPVSRHSVLTTWEVDKMGCEGVQYRFYC